MFLRKLIRYGAILGLLFSTTALAAEVTQDRARVVAQNWIQHLTKERRVADHASGMRQIAKEEVIFFRNTFVGYNFILHPSGHIVVPSRDELPPVKMYSDTTTLRMTDDSPVVEWIKEELFKLNESLDAHQGELAVIDHATTHNGRLWSVFATEATAFPQAYEHASPGQESLSLGPLLSTTWNQTAPYNLYAPLWYTGASTPTGCVATAAAQIMKYWNYPAMGQGSTSYTWSNGSVPVVLSRDFSTSTYNWSLMKNNHTTGDTAAEKDAVARLMSDVGIAFHMNYTPTGSGAYTLGGVTVFPTYFRYANTISAVYRTNYASDSAWMQVFKNEVQNGRPSQLAIRDPAAGGHSVVVDGYRDSPSEQIHINLGWGGSYDGWFVASNIAGSGFNFSDVNYQAAVIGIAPGFSVTSLTADKASPQVAGTPITFTATASGGVAPYQYKWWIAKDGVWTIGQAWGTSDTFSWTPTTAGSYLIQVWARNNGSTADAAQAYKQLAYTILAPPPLSVDSLTVTPASPQLAGTPITFTATATNGVAPYQYQFKWWVFNGTTWDMRQTWGASNTFVWTPTAPGDYTIQVWARNNGTTTDTPEAYRQLAYRVTGNALAVTGLTPDKPSPQPVSTPITFTATATGGVGPYQYKWWIAKDGAWTVGQTWGASNTFVWTPTAPGDYTIQVWARNNGTTTDTAEAYKQVAYTVTVLTVTSLTADKPSPQPPGTSITFTATATGGVAPYTYKWWVFNGVSWTVAQEWATGNTYTWTPTVGGTYQLQVWVRNNGTTTDTAEAHRAIGFTIIQQSQVRFLNNTCFTPNCTPYTARLRAEEGYTWDSFSGVFSPYQTVTSPTLSNFHIEAVGTGPIGFFPGTFNLASGGRYALAFTVDEIMGPVILLLNEGVATGATPETLGALEASIPGRVDADAAVRLAPAQKAPALR